MTKIWSYAFWGKKKIEAPASPRWSYRALMVPTGSLVVFTIVMGLFAQPFMALAERAAADVKDPANYINASLISKPGRMVPATATVKTPDVQPADTGRAVSAAY